MSTAKTATGERGCDGRVAQIAHNSWHPGFHPNAQFAQLSSPPAEFEPSVLSRSCTKVHPQSLRTSHVHDLRNNRPLAAIPAHKTERPTQIFKEHHETSSSELAILPRLRSQLEYCLCSIKALSSKVTLSLEQRGWGAKSYLALPCRLVTTVCKNFGTAKGLGSNQKWEFA